MFLGKQGDYIVTVSDNREELENIREIASFTSIEETNEPVERIDGQYIVGIENINSVMSNLRETAYKEEVDGITAHINRLRDETQTEDIVDKIAELILKRNTKVEEIKQRYPYSTGE